MSNKPESDSAKPSKCFHGTYNDTYVSGLKSDLEALECAFKDSKAERDELNRQLVELHGAEGFPKLLNNLHNKIKEISIERDSLKQKLDIAKDILNQVTTTNVDVFHAGVGANRLKHHVEIATKALETIEGVK